MEYTMTINTTDEQERACELREVDINAIIEHGKGHILNDLNAVVQRAKAEFVKDKTLTEIETKLKE